MAVSTTIRHRHAENSSPKLGNNPEVPKHASLWIGFHPVG
jgi:hypothetical protein